MRSQLVLKSKLDCQYVLFFLNLCCLMVFSNGEGMTLFTRANYIKSAEKMWIDANLRIWLWGLSERCVVRSGQSRGLQALGEIRAQHGGLTTPAVRVVRRGSASIWCHVLQSDSHVMGLILYLTGKTKVWWKWSFYTCCCTYRVSLQHQRWGYLWAAHLDNTKKRRVNKWFWEYLFPV